MRKHTCKVMALAMMGLTTFAALTSCSDDNNPGTITPDPNANNQVDPTEKDGGISVIKGDNLGVNGVIGSGEQEVAFHGNTTLKKGTYLLKGWVYVADGATLTIEPGTVIKGDKQTKAALIVERGGKLIAKGTQNAPIVFTSEEAPGERRPGDWGGVILCGKAKHNAGEAQIEGGPRTKHGGSDDNDNSGVLQYVRIEFAGYPFKKDQEINGLTLGSVGAGTTIDHIQVSYSNDDSYEWFGGKVNCKYLIAYKGWDDDFDTDNGFSGTVQYGLSVRDSRIADTSQSNGFESDNDASGSTATPTTSALFSNITFVGPKGTDANFQNTKDYINGGGMDPKNGAAMGLFQSAMQIRRGSHLQCVNSVAYGWPIGLIIDGEKGNTRTDATSGAYTGLKNIYFADMTAVGTDGNKVYNDQLGTWTEKEGKRTLTLDATKPSFSHTWFLQQTGNKYFSTAAELKLGANGKLNANVFPQSGSPLLGAASFAGITNSWLDKVTFIGAFDGTNDWTSGWTNFDPENTAY